MQNTTRLKDLAVSDTGFLFDPYSGATFTLNATGRTILEGLKEDQCKDEILVALVEQFDVTEGVDLMRDYDEFVLLLRQNELLGEDSDA